MPTETDSKTSSGGNSNQKSWTRTYILVLVFNAILVILFYLLSHSLNVK